MITNLTEYQLEIANWLAQEFKEGKLTETFSVHWKTVKGTKIAEIKDFKGKQVEITFAALQILETEELIQTIDKVIFDPPKPVMPKKTNALATPYSYPAQKWESSRTYTLRNDIFRASDYYIKRQLKKDAEKILDFMINRPAGAQFATRPELMSTLEMSDEKYEQVCQFLDDFDLIQNRSSIGMLWGDIKPTQRGRQVMHEKSMESLLLTQSPVVNYHVGDQINVTNTGENAAIAAGSNASAILGLTGLEAEKLFQGVFQKLEQLNLPDVQKQEVKETIELIEGEVQKENIDEKALKHYIRTLARMAPDILDVVIASALNPAVGAITVLKKIAEKAKADFQN